MRKLISLKEENTTASFYWNGFYIEKSPDGVKQYIAFKKWENPDVTLKELVSMGFIKSIESYNLAKETWNEIEPATDEMVEKFTEGEVKAVA